MCSNFPILCGLALIVGFASSLSPSAAAKGTQLYEVELVVFERLEQSAAMDPEAWSKNLNLAYPKLWKKLIDPAEAQQAQEDQWNLSEDGNGIDNTQGRAPTDDDVAAAANHFYEYLPKQQLQLKAQAGAINRAPELRVLYHHAWVQPLSEKPTAHALVLKGGNNFGDHHELEGSVTLSVNRYIHIQTDLWLTQFVPNRGQQSDHWPLLPAPPSKENPYGKQASNLDDSNTITGTDDTATINSAVTTFISEYQAAKSNSADAMDARNLSNADSTFEESQSAYLINQIVTMRQTRRMRSKEIHYLDNPRLGVLVLVTPVESASKPQAL